MTLARNAGYAWVRLAIGRERAMSQAVDAGRPRRARVRGRAAADRARPPPAGLHLHLGRDLPPREGGDLPQGLAVHRPRGGARGARRLHGSADSRGTGSPHPQPRRRARRLRQRVPPPRRRGGRRRRQRRGVPLPLSRLALRPRRPPRRRALYAGRRLRSRVLPPRPAAARPLGRLGVRQFRCRRRPARRLRGRVRQGLRLAGTGRLPPRREARDGLRLQLEAHRRKPARLLPRRRPAPGHHRPRAST